MGMRTTTWIAMFLAASGCAGDDLPGVYYDVSVSTIEDGCNTPDTQYDEQFSYRLLRTAASVQIFIGSDLLATGGLNGCDLTYESPQWNERRPDGAVRWELRGEALVSIGDGCNAGGGWSGTETITVVSSEDPSISAGCRYVTEVTGSYAGEIE